MKRFAQGYKGNICPAQEYNRDILFFLYFNHRIIFPSYLECFQCF